MHDYFQEARGLPLVAWRRDFHRHPEMGFREERTAGIVARHLEELGLEVHPGVAKTGVVGLLRGIGPGPVVMLRFDMDALAVTEENTHDFVSRHSGVMHACGHDGHTAMGMGAASLLARYRHELKGTVKFVFQPAEEGLGGAEAMIAAGVLEAPRPDLALALHLMSTLPAGYVYAGEGPVMAADDHFEITIAGRGGHGAQPHQAVDPVVAAAQVVTALQTVVSRNVDPLAAAVVTVADIRAGSGFNVIPGRAELKGTIRTFDAAVRRTTRDAVRRVSEHTARALGAETEVRIHPIIDALINDGDASARIRQAAAAVAGREKVSADQCIMVSEDMAAFLNRVPGCLFFLGAAPEDGPFPHHHPRFDFNESVLPLGVAVLCEAVLPRRK